MYSGICRETPTLRKHWYLQGKTHILTSDASRSHEIAVEKHVVFRSDPGSAFSSVVGAFWRLKCAKIDAKMLQHDLQNEQKNETKSTSGQKGSQQAPKYHFGHP